MLLWVVLIVTPTSALSTREIGAPLLRYFLVLTFCLPNLQHLIRPKSSEDLCTTTTATATLFYWTRWVVDQKIQNVTHISIGDATVTRR